MNSSLYNGLSGIKSSQFYMDVIGNNIANVSTNGYKGSTAEISSLFSSTLAGTYHSYANDMGLGAQHLTTALDMSQGILENTDNAFDLALNGEGWFGVQASDGNTYYTRAGSFSLDGSGHLVDGNGNYLLATSGNNIASTTLDQAKLDEFGKYYTGTNTSSNATPYAVTTMEDVPLGTAGKQGVVTLPDLLYYPPVPTSEVSYGANLDPTVTIDTVKLNLNSADYPATVTPTASSTVNFSGSVSNTTAALDPKEGDIVSLVLTDASGNTQTINTKLDSNLAWNVSNADVSGLDLSGNLTVTSATLQTVQEVANQEHFTASIIGADGNKDILDMTFTKVVPQGTSGTTWNADVKILSYYEDYTVENYDPTKTYDPSVYNVNTAKGTVTKIYDPSLYYVDTSSHKVYQIMDEQTGTLTFGGSGQLTGNDLPTLNNGSTALTLDLGTIGGYDGLISSTSITKSNVVSANGTLEGFLKDYAMDRNGNIIAEFTNGKSSALAKVAVYHFQNDQGLTSVSSNLFAQSANSGKAFFYTDANGDSFLGTDILNNKLEGSNVSLATALTELIVVQKSFSASSKSISTSDELLQNVINMKQ
jgi:flagellar hook protein FlgE